MRVTILEQRYGGGHFLAYVARLIRALDGVADEIVLATPAGCEASPQYGVHLASLRDRFSILPVQERWEVHKLSPIKLVPIYADTIRDAVTRSHCDAILIPGADGIAEAAGLARLIGRRAIPKGVHAEALLIRGPVAYGFTQARRTAFLQRLALRWMPFDLVHFIDPVVYGWAKSLSRGLSRRCSFVPDPIDPAPTIDKVEARQALGWPLEARIALSIGPQDDRKGSDVLLNAAKIAKLGPDDRIVMAGVCTPQIRELAAAMLADPVVRQRVILMDRYLSKTEFEQAMAGADLIVNPYKPQPHPSGVTLQAAAAGKRVLTSDKGWFAHVVGPFQLGDMCDAQSVEALAAALPASLDKAMTHTQGPACKLLLDFHHPDNFARAWRAGLLKRMGRTPDASMPSWDELVAEAKSLRR
ncbi:MAG: glycosyltransferase [Tepidisphaeraceae bacterium]